MSFTIYSNPNNHRAWKSLIVAQYAGVEIELAQNFKFSVDNKTPEFLAKFPLGKVPVMDTPNGPLFESNAMARYVARMSPSAGMYGQSFYENGLVDQWVDFTANEIEPSRALWIYPILGLMQFNKNSYKAAKADLKRAMTVLDKHLLHNTFLVGNQITLADIVTVSPLVSMYQRLFDPNFRKQFPNVNRWFTTCINQPQFKTVIGEIEFAAKEEKPVVQKQQKKKKQGKPSSSAAASSTPKKEKKKRNPLDLLPRSAMVLDLVKKAFFLKRDDPAAFFEEFWKNFDAEGYSIFLSSYNFNSENNVFFMTGNLIGGWMQRLESLRKYGFAAIMIHGKDEDTAPFNVSGVFIVRGKGMCPELGDCPDSEYHTFKPVDVNSADDRAKVEAMFASDKIGDEKILDRRYFK